MQRGILISFEGIDGCGKSSQLRLLKERLEAQGHDVLALREPGGTATSEAIRGILLDAKGGAVATETELLLFIAARAQIVRELIRPALAAGKIVLLDRFLDSTVAYQGYGRGIDPTWIAALNDYACGPTRPDLTLYFDLDVAEAQARLAGRPEEQNRMDAESIGFMQRTLEGFRALAAKEARIRTLAANRSLEAIQADVWTEVRRIIA